MTEPGIEPAARAVVVVRSDGILLNVVTNSVHRPGTDRECMRAILPDGGSPGGRLPISTAREPRCAHCFVSKTPPVNAWGQFTEV